MEGRDGPAVLVVGSANMDLVVSCDRFPQPGETILAGDFVMNPGGKGANQAVAAAKLGGEVFFLGKVGRDVFGEQLRASLARDGVRLDHLLTDGDASSGIALITVNAEGENEIIVVSGSNMRLTPADVDAHRSAFTRAGVVLVQLETPIETVERVAEIAREEGKRLILNPAPARSLPPGLLRRIDVLTPNETEAAFLSGLPVTDAASAERAGRRLLEQGVGTVVVTLGRDGALLVGPDAVRHFPARLVRAVDTTAAGDAFSGALALALATGQPLDEAIRFAGAVGTLAVTRMGAQQAMPTRDEVERFLQENGELRMANDE